MTVPVDHDGNCRADVGVDTAACVRHTEAAAELLCRRDLEAPLVDLILGIRVCLVIWVGCKQSILYVRVSMSQIYQYR